MDPTVRSVLRWTIVALAVSFAILLGTGLWLIANYLPADATLSSSVPHIPSSVEWAGRVRWIHRWTSELTVVLAVAVLVETVIGAVRQRRWRPALTGLTAPLVAVAGAVSGHVIAWDQLALYSVRIGEDLRGFRIVVDDQFRYALVGSARIDAGTFLTWFWVHVVVVPLLAVAGLVVASIVLTRRAPAAIASPAESVVAVIRE
jgi:quinol-cytochrome oxidoreductase complex cytochrome b subunit